MNLVLLLGFNNSNVRDTEPKIQIEMLIIIISINWLFGTGTDYTLNIYLVRHTTQ